MVAVPTVAAIAAMPIAAMPAAVIAAAEMFMRIAIIRGGIIGNGIGVCGGRGVVPRVASLVGDAPRKGHAENGTD
jgi:hypothetical protein